MVPSSPSSGFVSEASSSELQELRSVEASGCELMFPELMKPRAMQLLAFPGPPPGAQVEQAFDPSMKNPLAGS
jgi:hypothetical protein